jgi:multiple sugar transport system permease protein
MQARSTGQMPANENSALLARALKRRRIRRNTTAWLFLLPEVVFFAAFLLIPIGWVARQSFYSGGVIGPAAWVGLKNWSHFLTDTTARAALAHTLLFTATIVPIVFLLTIAVACLLRPVRRGGAVLRAVIYFPQVIPTVAAAQMWLFMINPDFGLLNVANRALGAGPINFIGSAKPAFVLIVLFEVWRGVGYWTIFILAAMLAVPRDRYEAAKLDGAPPLRRFWHVTIPGIRWPLAIAILLSAISALQLFDSVYILTDGGPVNATQTVVLYAYNSLFQSGDTGYASVLSLILLFLVVAMTGTMALALRRRLRPR